MPATESLKRLTSVTADSFFYSLTKTFNYWKYRGILHAKPNRGMQLMFYDVSTPSIVDKRLTRAAADSRWFVPKKRDMKKTLRKYPPYPFLLRLITKDYNLSNTEFPLKRDNLNKLKLFTLPIFRTGLR
uniref:Uncharacterized protein n=1 Tax=Glossina pallidipes TaxID=7398 RepID=A0A1B0A8P7_GLOPL